MELSTEKILKKAQNIAVMGCSAKAFRTSHQIAEYLQQNGYTIIPVNPNYDEILGEKVYPRLQDVPEEVIIDIVDIFRNKDYTAEMVDQVIERKEKTGQKAVVWTQLDVSTDEAKQRAGNAGLPYVENKCMMVEHKRAG